MTNNNDNTTYLQFFLHCDHIIGSNVINNWNIHDETKPD